MKKTQILFVLLLSIVYCLLFTVSDAAFEDFGIGARAMGMGNAYLAISGDATSIYLNPAGLVQVRRPEVDITAAGLFQPSGGSFYGYLGYAEPIYGLGYYFGAGYLSRNINLARRYRENTLGISYARPIDSNTSWGLTLKVCSKEYPDNTSAILANMDSSKFFTEKFPSGLSVDAGLMYSFPNVRGLKLGLACMDMGAGIWSFRPGVSYRKDELKVFSNILGDADVVIRGDGDWKVNLGIEAWFKPTEKLKKTLKENLFALRTGFKFAGGGDFSWAIGAGVRSNNLEKTDWKFDIAFVVPYHSSVESMSTGLWGTFSILFGDAFKWEKDEKARIDREKSLKEEMEKLLAEKRKLEEEKKMLEESQDKALDELKRLQGITIKEDKEKIIIVATETAINFASGSADVTQESYKALEEIAKALKAYPDCAILVEGHTDNVPIGPELKKIYSSNLELSKARAENVAKHFIESGIPSDKVITKGYGESKSIASNKTEDGRFKNRRVEITIKK